MVPVVLISGDADAEREKHPIAPFEFVQKPFLPAALLTSIERASKLMAMRKRAST